MKIFKRRILFILLSAFVFTVLTAGLCSAVENLEVEYPTIGGVVVPTTTKVLLSDYIKYLFSFSLVAGGLIAFSALILGGYKHTTSGGNPSKMADAKDQIFSAIIGLVILLSSFLILNSVNPKLTVLRLDIVPPSARAIELYTTVNLGGEAHIYGFDSIINNLDFDTYSIKISDTVKMADVEVYIYRLNNYEGVKKKIINRVTNDVVTTYGFVPHSIELVKKKPGVYLCTNVNCEGECTLAEQSIPRLSSIDLDNKVKSIYFVNNITEEGGYKVLPVRAILHADENYEGNASILLDDLFLSPPSTCISDLTPTWVGYGGSSLTVLYLNPDSYSSGEISLCRNLECEEENVGGVMMPAEYIYSGFNDSARLPDYWVAEGRSVVAYDDNLQDTNHFWNGTGEEIKDWPDLLDPFSWNTDQGVSAIKATGKYIVVLCENKLKDNNGNLVNPGRCWVFREQADPQNLTGWYKDDTSSSVMVIKIR
ncbi:MAG: pilin [bacterium]